MKARVPLRFCLVERAVFLLLMVRQSGIAGHSDRDWVSSQGALAARYVRTLTPPVQGGRKTLLMVSAALLMRTVRSNNVNSSSAKCCAGGSSAMNSATN